ncbi:hypothetical protein QBC32DRAFT_367603 [Pseudoneurospora amorphoporcata]|uniref:monoamine oxidase n=1 Tax=Pseudoneurospora amorphoporcata TaxID=241081 RepID=A0AAN6SIG0_9PEZI|nr:hypothetical protein QBC32DRAFT_367603 [Pseudoneurospora amorphoporcata]
MGSELLRCGESVVDVLIIGAGLSGLRAAVELHKAGLKIAVLERNNHVGGLCHSASTHDTARITSIGDTHTEMLSLAKDFKIDLVKQHRKGLSLLQRYDWIHDGPRVTENIPPLEKVVWPPEDSQLSFRSLIEDPAIQRFYRRISDLSKTWHGPDALLLDAVSFLQLVEANFFHSKVVTHEAHFLTSFLLGVHPARVSALYVLDHIASGGGLANLYFHPESPGGGAHHLRAPQGPQAFTNNLVDLLPDGTIHLSAVVNKITQNNNPDGENAQHPSYPCIIEATLYPSTITKAFHAKKVLLTTLPAFYSPLYSHCPGNIRLQPPLPLHKLASVNRHSGNHAEFATVTFYFTQPWWREAGLSGSLDCRVTKELDGPISWVRDTSEEDAGKKKVWTLTCWCAAEKGKEVWDWIRSTYSADDLIEAQKEDWDANPEKEQEEKDEGADEELVSFTFRNWNGIGIPAPSTLPKEGKEVEELLRTWRYEGPGKGVAVMREPFGNVHFAGTEMAEEWRGFMEGAARSGVRGAREVIEALKKGKNPEGGRAHL